MPTFPAGDIPRYLYLPRASRNSKAGMNSLMSVVSGDLENKPGFGTLPGALYPCRVTSQNWPHPVAQ